MKAIYSYVALLMLVLFNGNVVQAQDAPQVSSSSAPIWYKIHLSNWSDGASRDNRYLSNNGSAPLTVLDSEVSNADANLWRLDGSDLSSVKILSRSGKELYTSDGTNNTQVVLANAGSGTAWSVYSNSSISNSYYFGIASSTDVRINAGGETAGSFQITWGVGLYNQADNASAWLFSRVYSSLVSVSSADSSMGSVYIGTSTSDTSMEVISATNYTMTAVPTDGYIFKEWQLNGTTVSTANPYTATMTELSENTQTAYTAVFTKDVERTPAPTFTTEATTYLAGSTANISVACANASAIIYYTIDGSAPSESSQQVSNNLITLSSETAKSITIKIAAKVSSLPMSNVNTMVCTFVSKNAPEPLLPLPNARQLAYMKAPHAAFIHYGMNTYTGVEWGTGKESCSSFNPPKEVNTDQWVSVLKECGFDRVVLTGKHHDGFCLWPSQANTTAPHTIAQSPYKDGNGDLFEQLSESCTKYGLDMGVYLSPWDAYEENVGGHYTNTLYNDFYDTQLTEVLSQYGRLNEQTGKRELVEVWLDGATGSNNPPTYDFNRFVNTMRQYQPKAFVWIDALAGFNACIEADSCKIDGSWAMNESGQAPDPCWMKMTPSSTTNGSKNKPNGQYAHLLEADVSIRSGWFYGNGGGLKSAVDLFNERFMKSIGRGIPLILNIPPNTNGEFADEYVAVLRKYKEYLDTTFGTELTPSGSTASATQVRADDSSFGADKVIDGNYDTYWTMNDGQTTGAVTVDFGTERRFDIVQFQEYVPLGQRVSSWKVQVKVNGEWTDFASGTTIGFKRITKSKEVKATAVRLEITEAIAVPLINSLSIFRSHEDLIESDLPPVAGQDGQFEMKTDFVVAREKVDKTVSVTVQLKDRSNNEVSVYVATLPGTGVQGKVYQDYSTTLTFAQGEVEKDFTVTIIDNENNEGDKDFYIQLSNPTGDSNIGANASTRVWVMDDETPSPDYTLSVISNDENKGTAAITYPEDYDDSSITTDAPIVLDATAKNGFKFVNWIDTDNNVISSDAHFINTMKKSMELTAVFEENYPVMTRTFTNGASQQNRYLKSVTTTGTSTPTVFLANSQDELPYTSFSESNVGTYVAEGANIDKTANPIVLASDTQSFTMTFLGWTSAISGNNSELNWTQQGCFIDWNKNGSFTDTDEIYSKSSNTIGNDSGVCASFISTTGYTRTITVPENQPAGTYRMRVVYYEPASNNSEEWQKTIFSSGKNQLRNGISYDFALSVSPSSDVESINGVEAAKVIAGVNTINIVGDAQSIEVYTTGGTLVSRNQANTNCASGLYIVKVDGNVTKVIVK